MKVIYKYLIFFIIGIILCIMFKKRLVEGWTCSKTLTSCDQVRTGFGSCNCPTGCSWNDTFGPGGQCSGNVSCGPRTKDPTSCATYKFSDCNPFGDVTTSNCGAVKGDHEECSGVYSYITCNCDDGYNYDRREDGNGYDCFLDQNGVWDSDSYVYTCNAGYIKNTETKRCEQCPDNTYSEAGATECLTCEDGKRVNSNKTGCESCPVGYAGTNGTCSLCNAGNKYQDEAGQTECKHCLDSGKGIPVDRTGCEICNNGKASGRIRHIDTGVVDTGNSYECKDCRAGYYSDDDPDHQYYQNYGGFPECKKCEVGKYQPNTGQSGCFDCEPGTYQDQEGQTTCIACPEGRYTKDSRRDRCHELGCYNEGEGPVISGDGKNFTCEDCPPGHFGNSENPDYYYNRSCDLCPAGTIQPQSGQTSCDTCPDGQTSNNERTQCVTCTNNTYYSDSVGACIECPEGSVPNSIHSMCIYCDSNTDANVEHPHIKCNEGEQGSNFMAEGKCGSGWSVSEDGTQCLNDKCLIPSDHTGYIVDDVPSSDKLAKTNFNPTVHCDTDSGYNGIPYATVCNNPGEEFRLSGCLPNYVFSNKVTCGDFKGINTLDLTNKCSKLNKNVLENKKCYGEECNSTSYCCESNVPDKIKNLTNKIYFSDQYELTNKTQAEFDTWYDTINSNMQTLQRSLQNNEDLDYSLLTLKDGIMDLFNSDTSKYNNRDNFKENWIGGGGGQEEISDEVWERLINTINTNRETKLTSNDNLGNLTPEEIKLLLIKLDMPIRDSEGAIKYQAGHNSAGEILGLSPLDIFLHNNRRDDRGISNEQLEALL